VITVVHPKKVPTPQVSTAPVAGNDAGPVRNPGEGFKVFNYEKPEYRINEILWTKPYVVKGETFEEIRKNCIDHRQADGNKRAPMNDVSEVALKVAWAGKPATEEGKSKWTAVVLASTISVNTPLWAAPKKASPGTAAQWNSFATRQAEHDKGHVSIYENTLTALAESLVHIRAEDAPSLRTESDDLVRQILERTEKQQQGYDRRQRLKPVEPKKKD
jgi:predicted secreted Zn-dependent protease